MAETAPNAHPERIQILEMIERGVITPSQGVKLLEALSGEPGRQDVETPGTGMQPAGASPATGSDRKDPESDSPAAASADALPGSERWKRWWMIPMWTGVAITVAAGILMFAAVQITGELGIWFYCAGVPFIFGVAVMILAWYSRSSRWIHIRVHGKTGRRPEKIALSFPLPLRPAAWFLRIFGRWIQDLDQTGLDELILALGEGTSSETPLYVEVEDGEAGERVEVYIG